MLTISLQRIEFDGRHGATAVERRSTRKFEVDVEMEADVGAAEQSDLLADTVDYSRVAEVIVAIGTGEPHHLLESLARRMVDSVRERFPRRPVSISSMVFSHGGVPTGMPGFLI